MEEGSITLRVELRADALLGPGKAALLQGIRETGSIAAAGRRMGMSYKRAWYLIDTMNGVFQEPLVSASKGGKTGGGARLTPIGDVVLNTSRRMHEAAATAVADDLGQLSDLLKPSA